MLKRGILFFADRLPPLVGGMEMHAKYFLEYFLNHQQYPVIGVVTKDIHGQDCLIREGKTCTIDLAHLSKILAPNIIFFNSGRWIEELQDIKKAFPLARFIYRTGGNEIVKAPLIRNDIPEHKKRQHYWIEKLNLYIDLIITNSLYTELRLNEVGVAVPFERVVGGAHIAEDLAIRYQNHPIPTIFCAARFVPYKNHSLMIALIKELFNRGCVFQVRLAGDGPLLEQTQQQVKLYQLEQNITFLGRQDNAAVCTEIRDADIYMQLSQGLRVEVEGGSYLHCEGMGRSVLEAIAAGTFVIVGDSGALPEIVGPKEGLLLELDHISKMANKVEPLIRNIPQKNTPQTQFSWAQVVTRYSCIFGKS